MFRGRYGYISGGDDILERLPYHLEFEWIDSNTYDAIFRWIEKELKLDHVLDFTYLYDEHINYFLFIFKNEEDAAATKLRWQ